MQRIKVYIDDSTDPVAELTRASERFEVDTTALPDGAHRLRLETIEDGRVTGRREIPFTVRNGPGIAVAGLSDNDEVSGKLRLVADATDAGINHRLNVHTLEMHRGLPFWIGAFSIGMLLLAGLYAATDPLRYRDYMTSKQTIARSDRAIAKGEPVSTPKPVSHNPMQISLADGAFLPELPFDASKGDAIRGGTLFASLCADCHGPAAQGRKAETITQGGAGIYPRVAHQQPAYVYRQLYSFTHGWRQSPEMQRMAAGLSSQDMTDLAVYVAGLAETPYPAASQLPGDRLQLGEMIATKGLPEKGVSRCDGCHGPNGAGVAPHFPALIGQNAAYMAAQIEAFRSGRRRNALLRLMVPVAHGLDANEIDAVTRFYESLRPDGSG